QAQRDQDLEIKLGQGLGRQCSQREIQARAPAQHAHDELHAKPAVRLRQVAQAIGVQQFGGIGAVTLHTEQNVEGDGSRRRKHVYAAGLPVVSRWSLVVTRTERTALRSALLSGHSQSFTWAWPIAMQKISRAHAALS